MALQCFLLERTDTVRRWLRRYTAQHTSGWTCAEGWHEAKALFDDAPAIWEDHRESGGYVHRVVVHREEDRPPDEDPRWPAACEKCGQPFAPDETRQFFYDLLYRRVDTGALTTLRDAPPGAMWDAWWLHGIKGGMVMPTADGRHIMARCPNGRDWHIDGRASNCTLPQDDVHHCWIRHGEPPLLVVDKAGVTCSAGAGSIQAGDYHGFLGSNGAPPGWFT
jgi:hypothetical protein